MIGKHLIENTKLLSSGSPLASFTAWHSREGLLQISSATSGPGASTASWNKIICKHSLWKYLETYLKCNQTLLYSLLHACRPGASACPSRWSSGATLAWSSFSGAERSGTNKYDQFRFVLLCSGRPHWILGCNKHSRLCNSVPLDPSEFQRI